MNMKVNSEMCPEWADQELPVCLPVRGESNRWDEENIRTLRHHQMKMVYAEDSRFRRLCKANCYEDPEAVRRKRK